MSLKPQNVDSAYCDRPGGPNPIRWDSVIEEHHIIDVSGAVATIVILPDTCIKYFTAHIVLAIVRMLQKETTGLFRFIHAQVFSQYLIILSQTQSCGVVRIVHYASTLSPYDHAQGH